MLNQKNTRIIADIYTFIQEKMRATIRRKIDIIKMAIIDIEILLTITGIIVWLEVEVEDILITEVINIIIEADILSMLALNTYMNNIESTLVTYPTNNTLNFLCINLFVTPSEVLCYPNESNWECSRSDGLLLLSVWKRPQGRHDSKHYRSASNYSTSYQSTIVTSKMGFTITVVMKSVPY